MAPSWATGDHRGLTRPSSESAWLAAALWFRCKGRTRRRSKHTTGERLDPTRRLKTYQGRQVEQVVSEQVIERARLLKERAVGESVGAGKDAAETAATFIPTCSDMPHS